MYVRSTARYGTVWYGAVQYVQYDRSYGMFDIYGMYRSYVKACTDRTGCIYVGTYVRGYLVLSTKSNKCFTTVNIY